MFDYKAALAAMGISLSEVPPSDSTLKVGDKVEWTNDYGVKFESIVVGFNYDGWFQAKYEKFVHLNTDAFWFPHDHKTLRVVGE